MEESITHDGTEEASDNTLPNTPVSPVPKSPLQAIPVVDTCAACHSAIDGAEMISCRNKFFHLTCFKCQKCETQLTPNSKIVVSPDEKFTCMDCSIKCQTCQNIILDSAITTSRHTYHGECFNCTKCLQPIQNFTYAYWEDLLHCVPCYRIQKINSLGVSSPAKKSTSDSPTRTSISPTRDRMSVNKAENNPSDQTKDSETEGQSKSGTLHQHERSSSNSNDPDGSHKLSKAQHPSVQGLSSSFGTNGSTSSLHGSPRARKTGDQKRVFESLMNSPLWNDKRKAFNEFAVNSVGGSNPNLVSAYGPSVASALLGDEVSGSGVVRSGSAERLSKTSRASTGAGTSVSETKKTFEEDLKGIVQARRSQFSGASQDDTPERKSQGTRSITASPSSHLRYAKLKSSDESMGSKPTLTASTVALSRPWSQDEPSISSTSPNPSNIGRSVSSQVIQSKPRSSSSASLQGRPAAISKARSMVEPLCNMSAGSREESYDSIPGSKTSLPESPKQSVEIRHIKSNSGVASHSRTGSSAKPPEFSHQRGYSSSENSSETIARLTADIQRLKAELYEIYETRGTLEQMREEMKELQEFKYQKESLVHAIAEKKSELETLDGDIQACISSLTNKLHKSLTDESVKNKIPKDLEKVVDAFKQNILSLEQTRDKLLAENSRIERATKENQVYEPAAKRQSQLPSSLQISENDLASKPTATSDNDLHQQPIQQVQSLQTLPAIPSRRASAASGEENVTDSFDTASRRSSHASNRRRSKTVSSTHPTQSILREEEAEASVSAQSYPNPPGTQTNTVSKKWARDFLAKAVGGGKGLSAKESSMSNPQLNVASSHGLGASTGTLNGSLVQLHKGVSKRSVAGGMNGGEEPIERPYHKFLPHSYISPKKCDCCGDTLWGKELKCEHCGYHSHGKCSAKVTGTCINKKSQNSMGSMDCLGSSVTYGTTIKNIVRNDGQHIPGFIEKCVQIVDAKGLEYEGVYRKTGQISQINRIIAALKRGEDPGIHDTASIADIATITSALKQYLRDLADPLISANLYPGFMDIMRQEVGESRDQKLFALLHKLPQENQSVLAYLIRHLSRVHGKSAKNLMTASNLGVVFGPTLLRPSASPHGSSFPTPTTSSTNASTSLHNQPDLLDAPVKCALVEHLILHVDRFFPQAQILAEAITVVSAKSPIPRPIPA